MKTKSREEFKHLTLLQKNGIVCKPSKIPMLLTEVKGPPTTNISMLPTIHNGDIIISTKIEDVAELRVGDIIIFRSQWAGLDDITHRIVKIGVDKRGKRWFRTKGDNAPEPDPWLVLEEDVYCYVVGVVYANKLPISNADIATAVNVIKSMRIVEKISADGGPTKNEETR